MKKVNLCCGGQILEGWENYDINVRSKNVKFIDVLKDFPFEDKSVDLIYFCHTIEHFDEVQGYEILHKIKKCLKPNGTVRIVCPSLDTYVKRYLEWDQEFNDHHKKEFISRTRFLNYAFFGEHTKGMNFLDGKSSKDIGHKFIYSEEDLVQKLISLNFDKVQICDYNKSSHREFLNLDTCRPNFLDLIVEGSYSAT